MTRSTLSSALRLALLAAPVALAACSSTPMPTGYTYHNQIYKSPPGPEAPKPAKILKSGQDFMNMQGGGSGAGGMTPDGSGGYTASANMDANGHWDSAADDLVAMILRDLGKPMEKVFIPGADDFVTALKASLVRHDIPVAVNPGDGPFVIEHDIAGPTATIHFFSNHDKILTESGHYPEAGKTDTMAPVTSLPTPVTAPATVVSKTTTTTTVTRSGLNN
ncbi:MAG: putative lipoprotein [Micavibrio sp.]|nr:putative lipoprotein [Micavibrio sp.]